VKGGSPGVCELHPVWKPFLSAIVSSPQHSGTDRSAMPSGEWTDGGRETKRRASRALRTARFRRLGCLKAGRRHGALDFVPIPQRDQAVPR
jgi:hypothetical protein